MTDEDVCARCETAHSFYAGCACGIYGANTSKLTLRTELIRFMKIGAFRAPNELGSLEFVPEPDEERTDVYDPDFHHLIVRLVVWSESGRFIRDVKEQSIFVTTLYNDHGGRVVNFVAALSIVCREILARPDECMPMMPVDFFKFDPLGKKTFSTMAEFETALRKKSRLGRYL